MNRVYKIIEEGLWGEAVAAGTFKGAAIDLKDGYIHLSDSTQVEATAHLHFAGQHNLLLVAFDPADLGESLIWEVSRGGVLFPHVYGSLDPALALWAKPLAWNGLGHDFPRGWQS